MSKKLNDDQDRSRKDVRNAKDRHRRAAKGLTRGDGGGAGKGQGRNPAPDRPSCPHNRETCRLAMNGRDWRCRLDRGGCSISTKKQTEGSMRYNECANCRAKDGRAGNLFSRPGMYQSFCWNCCKTLEKQAICIDASLVRTDSEVKKTMLLIDSEEE